MAEKAEQLMTLCERCRERMELTFVLVEVPGTTNLGNCQGATGAPHEGPTHQYEYESRATVAMRRALEARKAKIDTGTKKQRERAPW